MFVKLRMSSQASGGRVGKYGPISALTPPPISDTRWQPNKYGLGVVGAVVCLGVLLPIAAWNNRYVLESDGIAYARIAWYYTTGQFKLALSGYWGPLLSWLMIPWIGLTGELLDAARIAMGVSAVVFLLGCIAIFQSLYLPPAAIAVGAWIVGMATVFWSVQFITPDLLVSGLLALALSRMLSPQWLSTRTVALSAGLLCGAAYLAKPIAFPVTFALTLAIAGLWMAGHQADVGRVLRSVALTLLGFALLAGSWVVILSLKYHAPLFTTSARMMYAARGPQDVKRYGHFRGTFHKPEAGRFFSWEEPSALPYRSWSPLESVSHAKHQARILYKNGQNVLKTLGDFDVFGLGLFALLNGLLMPRPWRKRLQRERWRWAVVPVACVVVFYLPFWTVEQRYFFLAYPFLLAASLGLVHWLTQQAPTWRIVPLLLGGCLMVGSFAYPVLLSLSHTLNGLDRPSVRAYELAQRLQAANVSGPVANIDNKAGLFVAFFLQQPWYGEERNTTVERVKASQAHLVVIHRSSSLIAELATDPHFRDLEGRLFPSQDDVQRFPWKVFQVVTPTSSLNMCDTPTNGSHTTTVPWTVPTPCAW